VTGGGSSIPEVQRLLAVLASGKRCAELGTAFGEGAAAIASTARSLVTTEADPERSRIARKRLAGLSNVEFFEGDWRETLPPRAPFQLVFLDAGGWKDDPRGKGQAAIDLLQPGGLLVKDDMTPRFRGPDPVREWLFGHPDLVATEVLMTSETAAILASRR
jgi:predicted O-methyltransferase YrrM